MYNNDRNMRMLHIARGCKWYLTYLFRYGSGPSISSSLRYRVSFAHDCAEFRFGMGSGMGFGVELGMGFGMGFGEGFGVRFGEGFGRYYIYFTCCG